MFKRPVFLVATLALLLFLAACDSGYNRADNNDRPAVQPTAPAVTDEPQAAEYRTLSIDEFADIVTNQNDTYTIVNVHIPYEGEIEGTDAHIPYNDLDALVSALPDKHAPIVLYCRSGRMSLEASEALVERGYTNVYDVPGGMVAWQQSGRELVDKQ